MNMEHWGQAVRESGRLALRGMDFGSDCGRGPWPGVCNQNRYADGKPPEFRVQTIRVPVALLSGAPLHRRLCDAFRAHSRHTAYACAAGR